MPDDPNAGVAADPPEPADEAVPVGELVGAVVDAGGVPPPAAGVEVPADVPEPA